MTEYDIKLSDGSQLPPIYPLETNGPNNSSTPRHILAARPSFIITNVITALGSETITVPGDETSKFIPGVAFQIVGSTGNDGTHFVTSPVGSQYNAVGDETIVPIVGALPNGVADGNVILHVFTLAGDVADRFITGFDFSVAQSPEITGNYTVTPIGALYDPILDFTTIPVLHGTIRDNVNVPIALPLGNISYVVPQAITSLRLPGRGTLNYGEQLIENLVRMTENFANDVSPDSVTGLGSNPPAGKQIGQLWYDTTIGSEGFRHFDGIDWTSSINVLDGSLIFNDPQNTIFPNSRIHLSGDESQLPVPYAGTIESGVVLWTEHSPVSGDPLFRVLSQDGADRLRVEHDGQLTTTNTLNVLGSGFSHINGSLGINTTTQTKTLSVVGTGIAVSADGLGVDAELIISCDATEKSIVNFQVGGATVGNIQVDNAAPTQPLELNSTVPNNVSIAAGGGDVVMVEGGGNVGMDVLTGIPTTILQIRENIYFDEGISTPTGMDIRLANNGVIGTNDSCHLIYDIDNTGTSSMFFSSGSNVSNTAQVRMELSNTSFVVDVDTLYVNTSSDRVGINMIPSYPFDVTGSSRFNSPVGIMNAPPNGSPVVLEVTGDVQVNSQIKGSNQSAGNPTFTFTNDITSGMWYTGAGVGLAVGGSNKMTASSNAIDFFEQITSPSYTFIGDSGTSISTSGLGQMEVHATNSINFDTAVPAMVIESSGIIRTLAPNYESLVVTDSTITNKKYVDDAVAAGGGAVTANGLLTLIKTVDGTGSGLDADLFQGTPASGFLRNNGDETLAGTTFAINTDLNTFMDSIVDIPTLKIIQNGAASDPFMTFRINGAGSVNLGLNHTNNKLSVGGLSLGNNIYEIWHAGNQGTGSGLDADTFQGLAPSDFLRNNGDEVLAGTALVVNTDPGELISTGTHVPTLRMFQNNIAADAFSTYQINGGGSVHFGLDHTNNKISVGGLSLGNNIYEMWHAGNQGSGSGLDADTVDGVHASNILQTTGANTITSGTLTLNDNMTFSMGSGLDFRTFFNGAHLITDIKGTADWYIRDADTAGDVRFTFDIATGNFVAFGTVTGLSDVRIKENIEIIPDALDKVCSLSGYTFDRTDIADVPRQTGVLAQEVIDVLPEAVVESENGMLSVAYGNMMGLLIEAIKEQHEIVTQSSFYIEVDSDGTIIDKPDGWDIQRSAVGSYMVTHNLGTTKLGYSLSAFAVDGGTPAIVYRDGTSFVVQFDNDVAFGGRITV